MSNSSEQAAGVMPFQSEDDWKNFFDKFGENGRTFQDFTNLTPQSMEVIYMVAFNQYNGGRYDEAEKIFQLLSVLNHFDARFWTGLGASREMQKKYTEAVKAYSYLAVLDLRDPMAPMLSAKCFLAQGKVDEADSALQAAIFNSQGKPEYAEIKQQAENLLELLNKSKASN